MSDQEQQPETSLGKRTNQIDEVKSDQEQPGTSHGKQTNQIDEVKSDQEQHETSHGRRTNQIDKTDLYMLTALWMEESPWAAKDCKEKNFRRVVGSVFVLPHDRVLSVDCSRQVTKSTTVHGAVRPLIKYPDKVRDCDVYLSRKPCANCVKMLVQAGVKRVMFLPLEPELEKKELMKEGEKDSKEVEKYNREVEKHNESVEEDSKAVDALFQVSEVRKSFYIPDIKQEHINELEKGKNPYGQNEEQSQQLASYLTKWNEWVKNKEGPSIKDLRWEQFGDDEIKSQVIADMKNTFTWFCFATFGTGSKEMKWKKIDSTKVKEGGAKEKVQEAAGTAQGQMNGAADEEKTHLSRMAQMLSRRTGDPKRGVGCVFTDGTGKEIISIGWNGFPSKALYGNHPRGSDDSKPGVKRKYLHVIHAEQNGLFCRNQRSLQNCTVYVNKIPCNECMPLLYENGARKIVLPELPSTHKETETCFNELLDENDGPPIEVYSHIKNE